MLWFVGWSGVPQRDLRPRENVRRGSMSLDALLWFGIGGAAAMFALSLFRQRYIQKTPRAMQSGGSFTLFAFVSLLLAVLAIATGILIA